MGPDLIRRRFRCRHGPRLRNIRNHRQRCEGAKQRVRADAPEILKSTAKLNNGLVSD